MKQYEIHQLPVLCFAHEYKADVYTNTFSTPGTDLIEITYIVEGSLNIHTEEGVFTANKGDVMCSLYDTCFKDIAESFHCHRTVCASVTRTESPNGLYLPFFIKAGEAKGTQAITDIIDNFVFNPYLYENNPTRAGTDFLRMLCKIDEIYRTQHAQNPIGGHPLASKAKKYIYANLHKPLTQKEIAAYLNVTPQYLCRIFKQTEGVTPIKYMNRAKLQRIKVLMEKEHLKLYEAAQLYGFSDPNYVSHLYHKTFGHTITERPGSIPDIKPAIK